MKGSQKEKILPYLQRAFRNWSSLQTCSDQRQCDELKKRVRALVFDWNRSEKKNPSESLLQGYEAYFSVETQDEEAFELAAQAAVQAKSFERAYTWIQKAHSLTADPKKQETLLVRRIEIAELAKNTEWLKASQAFYLENSSKQSKSTEIRYQMAQQAYDVKNYQSAANQFKAIASNPSTEAKLKLQSAEMALDASVLTKNDAQIESWAREFATLFPKDRKRFLSLAGQSVLSQTAHLSGSQADSNKAWETLTRFDISTADAEKKKTFFKNKIILARKLKKFSEMDSALRSFLSLKNLTPEENKFGLENRVWLSELQLNFLEAFHAYKKLNTGKWLEVARLADLAEQPSSTYYYNYLKKAEDKDLAFSICVKLVKEAKSFGSKQKTCLPYLSTDKNFMAGLLMEIYSGKKSNQQLAKIMRTYGLQKTPAAAVLERGFLIERGEKDIAKLKKHQLDGRTQRVAGSIQRRSKLILNFEKTIQKATQTQDWLTQTMFLTELSKQYFRFYEELLALPTPKDLTPEEQQQYVTLLGQQASVFKEKGEQINFKLEELWKNEAIDQVYADFHKSPRDLQRILGPRIGKMKMAATPERASSFDLVYRSEIKKTVPSIALLETARTQVKNSPMNKSALRNLIELETKRGYQPMIIYLNSRLKMVDQGFESTGRSL